MGISISDYSIPIHCETSHLSTCIDYEKTIQSTYPYYYSKNINNTTNITNNNDNENSIERTYNGATIKVPSQYKKSIIY